MPGRYSVSNGELHDDAEVLGPTDRDVEPIPVEQERDSARHVVGRRCGHRHEHHRRLSALELVDGAHLDLGQTRVVKVAAATSRPERCRASRPARASAPAARCRRSSVHGGAEQTADLGDDRVGFLGAVGGVAVVLDGERPHSRAADHRGCAPRSPCRATAACRRRTAAIPPRTPSGACDTTGRGSSRSSAGSVCLPSMSQPRADVSTGSGWVP